MGKPMFRFFFGDACSLSQLEVAVGHYQKLAMLRYGNFVFAYRTLSRIADEHQFATELGSVCVEGDRTGAAFTARTDKLLEVENISREDTPLVGYLSATQIVAEAGRSKLLRVAAKSAGNGCSWEALENAAFAAVGRPRHAPSFEHSHFHPHFCMMILAFSFG